MDIKENAAIFGRRVKELCAGRGMTLGALADDIGIYAPTLSRYMSGTRIPDPKYIVMISNYFGVSVDWMLGLSNDKYRELPRNLQELVERYLLADERDRAAVDLILSRYGVESNK